MRNEKGQFVSAAPDNILPVGSIRIRTRHKRNGERRAFIKVSEPNTWILLARHIWEQSRGPIPRGYGIHHKDGNKLNDDISNLDLVSKAEHLLLHRREFHSKAVASFIAARRTLRWSTKSATKRTGRPPRWSDAELIVALNAIHAGESICLVERRLGISRSTLYRKIR